MGMRPSVGGTQDGHVIWLQASPGGQCWEGAAVI